MQSSTTNEPLVSVIIPSFNYGHFILSTIESVQQQDYPQIEIIVIDDGSTDNTAEVLPGVEGITYVRQQNQGLPAARNHGIRLARGKYVQFLDADDLLGSSSIRERVDYLERHPDHSAVVCRNAFFYDNPYPESQAAAHEKWKLPEPGLVDLALYYFNIAPPHAFLVRKSVIDAHRLVFDERLRACEDYDYWFRLARVSSPPGMVDSSWVFYRQHAASMSRSYQNQYRHDAELCRRIFNDASTGSGFPGHRPSTDYLSAMFAASVKTARRLWQVDRDSFGEFVSGHLLPLQQQLESARKQRGGTAAAQWYLAEARLVLYRMWLRDQSLTPSQYRQLAHRLTGARSFLLAALISSWNGVSLRIFKRLLALDARHIAMLLFLRRDSSGTLPGQ